MARPRTSDGTGVVDAARDVFARNGLCRALMSDLARSAGVSVGTLYNIATSKDARLPLRWVVRASVRSCGSAPMWAVACASTSDWSIVSSSLR